MGGSLTDIHFEWYINGMQNIISADFGSKSSEVVKTLKKGDSISVIHDSKVIGKIEPAIPDPKPFDPEKFREILKKFKPKKIIPRSQREKVYRQHLMEKYGKGLS